MKRAHVFALGAVACVAVVASVYPYLAAWAEDPRTTTGSSKQAILYELRTYTTAEGRLDALHKRFRDHTLKLFEKHGMKNVIYWTPTDKKNTLVYVIAHKSQEAAEKSWDAFRNDPEWKRVYAASREDGPIVTKVTKQFLVATDYSPK